MELKNKTINFFSVCSNHFSPKNPSVAGPLLDKHFEDFILPFIFFALNSSKNAWCEIVVNSQTYKKENEKAFLELSKQMGKRFTITEKKLSHGADVSRFLIMPTKICDYTYISDIDILITENSIENYYNRIFSQIKLPYSNIRRGDAPLLTGTFCANTQKYYTQKMKSLMNTFFTKNLQTQRDESVLFDIVSTVHGLPTTEMNQDIEKYRPIHGIHTSLSRPPRAPDYQPDFPSWDLTELKIKQFDKITQSKHFKAIYPFFTDRYKNILNKIL